MQPTRETYPFDQQCAICHTPIPAETEHTHLSVGDHHPRTAELCDPCARTVTPIWRMHGPGRNADAGELSIAESLQLTAIAMLEQNMRERHTARRLLHRYGWNRRTIHTIVRLRRRLREHETNMFIIDATPETQPECFICETPINGRRGMILCDEGMIVTCQECADLIGSFALGGWMDEGQPPETNVLLLWAQRFAPRELERIAHARMLNMLKPGRTVAVLCADGKALTGPLEHRNGEWWCKGTPVCDDTGQRYEDILAILPGVEWEDAD